MDFGLPLESHTSVASKSKIRQLQPIEIEAFDTEETNKERFQTVKLDNEVVQAANETVVNIFIGNPSFPYETDRPGTSVNNEAAFLLDASSYTDRVTPAKPTIQKGDLVVIQESFDRLDFVYCKPGEIYNNRNGAFHHDDFVGKPFGSKIRSRNLRGFGFIYMLKPTPELWTRSLNLRTQVVHDLDQSQIIFQLYIRPNDVIVESGTGSGAMSHAFLRTIAPAGHLHTYEFSRHRANVARLEFEQHGLSHLVTVHHKDVCYGLPVNDDEDEPKSKDVIDNCKNDSQGMPIANTPGFDLPEDSVDAVFLDLPEPWMAVAHAAKILRPNARIASYSPCVEQTQRTVKAMDKAGFHSIKTMEYRQKQYYVDEVEYEAPPTDRRPKHTTHDVNNYPQKHAISDGEIHIDEDNETSAEADIEVSGHDIHSTGKKRKTLTTTSVSGTSPKSDILSSNVNGKSNEMSEMLVARPFAVMRGHTAFLTFATKNPTKFADTVASTLPSKS